MKLIGYYRVSTKKQGESGLGLDAQRADVEDYRARNGAQVLGEYVEVESGKRNDRPELAKALAHAKAIGATLIVAKLDRLARNARFLLSVVEGSGEAGVVFCDLPNIPPGAIGKFIITNMAGAAELEGAMISARTKAGLKEARKRGTLLGAENEKCRNLTPAGQKRGSRRGGESTRAKAAEYRAAVQPLALELAQTLKWPQIAEELNRRGYTTFRGLAFDWQTVRELLKAK